jgi:hypothetical protein
MGIAGAKPIAERWGETEGIADAEHEAIVPPRAEKYSVQLVADRHM